MKNVRYLTASITLVVVACFALSVAGCSSSSTEATTTTPPVTPKVGSSYIFVEHDRDSTGGQPATVTDTTISYTVISSGDTVAGMPNTFTTRSSMGDTTVWAFDAKGDFYKYTPSIDAIVFTLTPPNPWVRIPTTTQDMNVPLDSFATNVSYQGFPLVVTTVITSSYVGTDKLTVNATEYAGSQGSSNASIRTAIPLNGTIEATVNDLVSVDNSIGFFFHTTQKLNIPAIATLAASGSVHERWLTTYTLVK